MTLEETRPMKSFSIEIGDKKWVMENGGGGGLVPGVPIPADTVNSDAIIDGSIKMEDLSQDVKDAVVNQAYATTEEGQDAIAGLGDGGGGSVTPGVPIPANTVNSAAIIDGSIEMEDLNQSVKDEMMTGSDRVTQDDLDGFEV